MQKTENKIAFAIIVLICYMYIITVSSFFQINLDFFSILEVRSVYLSLIIIIWGIVILLKRKIRYNKMILYGLLLTVYMICLGLKNHGNTLSWISCVAIWFLILFISYNNNFNEKNLERIPIIFFGTACILSLIYIFGMLNKGNIKTVANSNSIYYILTILPFSFCIKKNWTRLLMLIMASIAIIISGKSTCLIALILTWIIFIKNYLNNKNNSLFTIIFRIIIVTVLCILLWKIVSPFISETSYFEVINNLINEFVSGGNGRADIYKETLTNYFNSKLLFQFFGHGYNSINNVIGIGTHNDFLMVLYNYGIIGLIFYLGFWIQLIKEYLIKKKQHDYNSAAYLCSIIIFICLSMASNVLNTQIQFLILCIFWGMYSNKNMIRG